MLPQPWRARAELDLSPGVPDLSGFPRAAWLPARDPEEAERHQELNVVVGAPAYDQEQN